MNTRVGSADVTTLSPDQAWSIVTSIQPTFRAVAGRYDESKYWPDVYDRVLTQFADPQSVTSDAIRQALLWKWGHLGKKRIPAAHEHLISQISVTWPEIALSLGGRSWEVFTVLDRRFGGRKRFVTIAFLTHLLHPSQVPIIDQHNFRAMNKLLWDIEPARRSRATPDRYQDLETLTNFMAAVLSAWRARAPLSAPTARDMDKYLMMFGKSLKRAS